MTIVMHLYSAFSIGYIQMRFTIHFRDEIRRQLLKAPMTAVISPFMISHPTHPIPTMNTCEHVKPQHRRLRPPVGVNLLLQKVWMHRLLLGTNKL